MKQDLYILSYKYFFKPIHINELEQYFNVKLINSVENIVIKNTALLIWVDNAKQNYPLKNFKPSIILTNRYRTLNKFKSSLILPCMINNIILQRIINHLQKGDDQKLKLNFKKSILRQQTQLDDINMQLNELREEKLSLEKTLNSIRQEQTLVREKDHLFRKELKLAGELQKDLLPKSFPFTDRVNFSSLNLPSKYIGGDFYDIVKIDENKFAVFIIDVAGHGIRSAIIASMSKILFHNFILSTNNLRDAMLKINNEFYNSIFNDDDFLTTFVIIIDLKEMKANYINAGHPSPLLINPNGDIMELKKGGFFVGSFQDTDFEEGEINLDPGYRFLLYTDGIIETKGNDDGYFGKERLKSIVDKNNYLDISGLGNEILTELLFYSKDTSFMDDITIVLLELI